MNDSQNDSTPAESDLRVDSLTPERANRIGMEGEGRAGLQTSNLRALRMI